MLIVHLEGTRFTNGYHPVLMVSTQFASGYRLPLALGAHFTIDTHWSNVYPLNNGALSGKLLVVITKTYSLQSVECLKFQKLLLCFL